MRRQRIGLIALVGVLAFGLLSTTAEPHNPFAGDYDTSIAVAVKGEVTSLEAQNFGTYFNLAIKTEGGVDTWRVEAAAAGAQTGMGIMIGPLMKVVAQSRATVTVWLYPPRICAASLKAASVLKECKLRQAGAKEIEVDNDPALAAARGVSVTTSGGRFPLSFADAH